MTTSARPVRSPLHAWLSLPASRRRAVSQLVLAVVVVIGVSVAAAVVVGRGLEGAITVAPGLVEDHATAARHGQPVRVSPGRLAEVGAQIDAAFR